MNQARRLSGLPRHAQCLVLHLALVVEAEGAASIVATAEEVVVRTASHAPGQGHARPTVVVAERVVAQPLGDLRVGRLVVEDGSDGFVVVADVIPALPQFAIGAHDKLGGPHCGARRADRSRQAAGFEAVASRELVELEFHDPVIGARVAATLIALRGRIVGRSDGGEPGRREADLAGEPSGREYRHQFLDPPEVSAVEVDTNVHLQVIDRTHNIVEDAVEARAPILLGPISVMHISRAIDGHLGLADTRTRVGQPSRS